VADVQTEHGHVRIANELWDAWMAADLTASERRVLMAVVRQSYGFGRKTTADWASLSALESYTRAKRSDVSKGLRGLRQKGVIVRIKKGVGVTPSEYAPQKDYDLWGDGVLPDEWRPIGVPESSLVTESSPVPKRALPSSHRSVTPQETREEPRVRKKKNAGARKPDRAPNPLPGPGRAIEPIDVWRRLGGTMTIPATLGRHSDVMPQEHLPRICDANTVEDINDAIDCSLAANNPRRYFFALFDLDTGKRKVEAPRTPRAANTPIDWKAARKAASDAKAKAENERHERMKDERF